MNENYTMFSWAMDATAENWCAVVEDDYGFILPVPYSSVAGLKRARQQSFSRQVDFIGEESKLNAAIALLKSEFKSCDIRVSQNELGITDQKFQYLNLEQDFQMSTNAKRMIKKSAHLKFEKSENLEPLLNLYRSNTHQKLNQADSELTRLENLMRACMTNEKGFLFNAWDNERIVGSCFIIENKSTATYLIGDAEIGAKKEGVIYGMINFAIQNALEAGMKHFDFGGSNVESVAQFYRKFGAEDKMYSRLNWDELPKWFKWIKRFKK